MTTSGVFAEAQDGPGAGVGAVPQDAPEIRRDVHEPDPAILSQIAVDNTGVSGMPAPAGMHGGKIPSAPEPVPSPEPDVGLFEGNLENILKTRDRVYANDRFLYPLLPIILKYIDAGLGIDVIFDNARAAGYAGAKDAFVDWIAKHAPSFGQYRCKNPGCMGILAKQQRIEGGKMIMKWVCPICGQLH